MHVPYKQSGCRFLGCFFTTEYEWDKQDECQRRFCCKAVERTPRLWIDDILKGFKEAEHKFREPTMSISCIPQELIENPRYHTEDWPKEFFFQWLDDAYTRLCITHYNNIPNNKREVEVSYLPTPDGKGRQTYFICPHTGKRVKHLYMNDLYELRVLKSKEAWGLNYTYQLLTKNQRQVRPEELYRNLERDWKNLLWNLYPYLFTLNQDFDFLASKGTNKQLKLYKRIIEHIYNARIREFTRPNRYRDRISKEEQRLRDYAENIKKQEEDLQQAIITFEKRRSKYPV